MSKKLINLLRHGSLPREDDGAIITFLVELEIHRNITAALLHRLPCAPSRGADGLLMLSQESFKKVIGPIEVHVDIKGTINGSRRGEKECIAGDADLWIKIWEELHELVKRGILVEVEHVKAHGTKKEKEKLTQL